MSDKKEETEEKPKAVIEMEENSDVGKAKKKLKEKKELDAKEANKRFFIKYAIFVIVIATLTGIAIYFSVKYLNKETKEETEIVQETISSKPIAADSKYAIKSYDETYNENSITIKFYSINDKLIDEENWRRRIFAN